MQLDTLHESKSLECSTGQLCTEIDTEAMERKLLWSGDIVSQGAVQQGKRKHGHGR